MNGIRLRRLDESDENAYYAFIGELLASGERVIPAIIDNKNANFHDWLKRTKNIDKGLDLPDGWVASTVYFLINEKENKILGAIDIRHELNDFLLKFGGNIGYSILPSERRKGYGSLMLKMALEICKEMGLKKVLITCDFDNIGSAMTIIKNGGQLENVSKNERGVLKKRFWIQFLL